MDFIYICTQKNTILDMSYLPRIADNQLEERLEAFGAVLIECKLGSNEIEEGSKHLLELKRLIQEHNKGEKQVPLREPDLLIILTGGSMAYTRPDGVKIIPLACLKN